MLSSTTPRWRSAIRGDVPAMCGVMITFSMLHIGWPRAAARVRTRPARRRRFRPPGARRQIGQVDDRPAPDVNQVLAPLHLPRRSRAAKELFRGGVCSAPRSPRSRSRRAGPAAAGRPPRLLPPSIPPPADRCRRPHAEPAGAAQSRGRYARARRCPSSRRPGASAHGGSSSWCRARTNKVDSTFAASPADRRPAFARGGGVSASPPTGSQRPAIWLRM